MSTGQRAAGRALSRLVPTGRAAAEGGRERAPEAGAADGGDREGAAVPAGGEAGGRAAAPAEAPGPGRLAGAGTARAGEELGVRGWGARPVSGTGSELSLRRQVSSLLPDVERAQGS